MKQPPKYDRFTDTGDGLKILIPEDGPMKHRPDGNEPASHDVFRIDYQNLTGFDLPEGIGHAMGEEAKPPKGWVRLPLAIKGRLERSVPALMWRPDPTLNIFVEDWITKDTPLERIQFSAYIYARADVPKREVEKVLNAYLPGVSEALLKGRAI
jgi:hypothetical protein